MTYVEEFRPEQEEEFEEESNYPTAFGITFTPPITGIALAIVGLVGAIYLGLNFVSPAWTEYNTQIANKAEKEAQLKQLSQVDLNQKLQQAEADKQKAKNLQTQVLSLFATDKNLDTILLDVNRIFKSRKVELTNFVPQGTDPTPITDGSLGPAANNKLKRQSFNLSIAGGFEQTRLLLQDLEKMQPLILVKNLNSQLNSDKKAGTIQQNPTTKKPEVVPTLNRNLTTTLRIDLIIASTPEELANLSPPPAPK
jgi:Tfp pilus assembly protein PilO